MKKVPALLFLILITFTLTACNDNVDNALDVIQKSTKQDVLIFGIGSMEEGITENKSTFDQNEDFLMETTLSNPFGTTDIEFIILKIGDNGTEEIYDQWVDTVDPAWDWLIYEFQRVETDGVFDPGNYIVRMYNDESDLLAEGPFTIR